MHFLSQFSHILIRKSKFGLERNFIFSFFQKIYYINFEVGKNRCHLKLFEKHVLRGVFSNGRILQQFAIKKNVIFHGRGFEVRDFFCRRERGNATESRGHPLCYSKLLNIRTRMETC